MLIQQGHTVSHLSRAKKPGSVPTYVWNIPEGKIDDEALKNIDTVIHLAGEGIADKRWTEKRKREILESRTQSTSLLTRYVEKYPNIKTVISASAIGYYGETLSSAEFTETSNPGNDFLASVVKAWENEADKIQNKRIVKIRTGIVLSEKGGALKEMARPVRWGVGAPLGTGEQYVSWIHIDDLCKMYIKAVEDAAMQGAYNATGPYAVTNYDLTRAIAKVLHKPLWLPAVPSFVLKIMLGEMADLLLYGSVVSSKKIQQAGFTFQFPTLEKALADLFKR